MQTRLITRTTVICNGPDWVRDAFLTNNAAVERKSPQMRYALKPLLGDGLFISDGPVWAKRRKIVSPIIHASRLPEFAPIMVEAAIGLFNFADRSLKHVCHKPCPTPIAFPI